MFFRGIIADFKPINTSVNKKAEKTCYHTNHPRETWSVNCRKRSLKNGMSVAVVSKVVKEKEENETDVLHHLQSDRSI